MSHPKLGAPLFLDQGLRGSVLNSLQFIEPPVTRCGDDPALLRGRMSDVN